MTYFKELINNIYLRKRGIYKRLQNDFNKFATL